MLGLGNSDDYLGITRPKFKGLIEQEPAKESVWPVSQTEKHDG